MGRPKARRDQKRSTEESDEESDREGRSYEVNSAESDDGGEEVSLGEDMLMMDIKRRSVSKSKGYEVAKKIGGPSNAHVSKKSTGKKKAKVTTIMERTFDRERENNTKDKHRKQDLSNKTVPTKHHGQESLIRHKGQESTNIRQTKEIVGRHSQPTKASNVQNGKAITTNVIKNYKTPAPIIAVAATPLVTSPPNSTIEPTAASLVERVHQPNSAPCTRRLLPPSQPSYVLIQSAGFQSEGQNLPPPQNSEIPLIETDFSQPQESVGVDSDIITPDDGNMEQGPTCKTFISLDGENFVPDITRHINKIVMAFWRGPHINWNQVPNDIKDMWWAHFVNTFQWEPHLEGEINKLFKKKASAKIRNFVSRAKLNQKKPSHVTIEDWELMKTKFTDTKYTEKCKRVQEMRKKIFQEGGTTYCGGSINANEHRKRLSKKYDREPTVLEIFSETHKNKHGQWSGKRAAEVADAYKALDLEEMKLPKAERRSEREVWIQAVGGRVNGRVLGLGYVGTQSQLSGSTPNTQISLELSQHKQVIASQQEEIHSLKESHLENIKCCEELKTQVQMLMQMMQNKTQSTPVEDDA